MHVTTRHDCRLSSKRFLVPELQHNNTKLPVDVLDMTCDYICEPIHCKGEVRILVQTEKEKSLGLFRVLCYFHGTQWKLQVFRSLNGKVHHTTNMYIHQMNNLNIAYDTWVRNKDPTLLRTFFEFLPLSTSKRLQLEREKSLVEKQIAEVIQAFEALKTKLKHIVSELDV